MHYFGFDFIITENKEMISDILVAELAECGFEMFEETESGLKAFVQSDLFDKTTFADVQILRAESNSITFTKTEIPYQNWNKDWESNFNPVVIANRVLIRAEFHEPNQDIEYEIIIQPEMSFGTGHHETTSGIIELMLDVDFKNKSVCDMGCGTSILSIMAEKLGAILIDAVDNDEYCILNSKANLMRNQTKFISAHLGDAGFLKQKTYDIIIANINRNILLNDIQYYSKSINAGGLIFLSGFYSEDLKPIEEEANKFNLKLQKSALRNNWCAAIIQLK